MLNQVIFPNDTQPDHFAALDGLRGIAVLLVVLSHAEILNLRLFKFLSFEGMGVYGVQLFFVLSAYLLDRQIATAFVQHKANAYYWLNYALRRFLRIFPLFFLSLLLYHYLTMYVHGNDMYGHTISLKDIGAHLLLQKGEGFYWSIPVEFKYYFLSPLLMAVCHYAFKWDLKKIIPFFIVLIVLSYVAKNKWDFSKISTLPYLGVFLVGTTLSIIELQMSKRLQQLQQTHGWLIEAMGWAAVGFIVWSFQHGANMALKNALLWGMVLFATKYGYGIMRWMCSWTWLRVWGVVSFSAYLLHRAVLGYVRYADFLPFKSKIWVFLVLSLLVALCSYLLIEKPLARIQLNKRATSLR